VVAHTLSVVKMIKKIGYFGHKKVIYWEKEYVGSYSDLPGGGFYGVQV